MRSFNYSGDGLVGLAICELEFREGTGIIDLYSTIAAVVTVRG